MCDCSGTGIDLPESRQEQLSSVRTPAGYSLCRLRVPLPTHMKAIIKTSGAVLVDDVETADSLFARLKGLLGRSSLPTGHALWLRPCNGIHTFGMRFPIDVVILDSELRVVASVSDLLPNRVTPVYLRAASVLELPAGTLAGMPLAIGEQVVVA